MILLTGCSSETNDNDSSKDPADVKDPTDLIDPEDDYVPTEGTGRATDLLVGVKLDEVYNGDGIAYTLTIDAAGFYSIKSIGDIDLEGTLSDFLGRYVSSNDNISDTDDNFEIIIYLETGTYLVGVSAVDDNVTSGLFSIIVESTSIEQVSIISVNGMIADSIFPGSTNTVEFNVPSDGYIQLYTVSLIDTYGVVYDSNGNIVAENDIGVTDGDFYIDTFLESGTYSIEISVNGDFDFADYELFYNFVDNSIIYEPISVDSFVTGSFDTFGDVVLYFELTVTETVTVNIYTISDNDFDGYIYMSRVAMIPFEYNMNISEDNWNFMIDNLTLEAGTYYLEVDGWISEWYSTYYELHVDTVE
jgi:hypothetical protein